MTRGDGGGGDDSDDDNTLYPSNLNCLILPDQAVTTYATLNITWPGSVYIQTTIRLYL